MRPIDNYLVLLEIQDKVLNEAGMKAIISKFTPESKTIALVKKLNASVDKKDPLKSLKKVKSLLSFVPKVPAAKVDSFLGSNIPDYKKFKTTSNTVLKNSLSDVNPKVLDYASSFLALSAFIVPKGKNIAPDKNLKTNIKDFVMKTRKFIDDHEEKIDKTPLISKEDLPDIAVASVIITTAIGLAGGIIYGSWVVASAIASGISAVAAGVGLIASAIASNIMAIVCTIVLMAGLLIYVKITG
jgi:hypothetical protein